MTAVVIDSPQLKLLRSLLHVLVCLRVPSVTRRIFSKQYSIPGSTASRLIAIERSRDLSAGEGAADSASLCALGLPLSTDVRTRAPRLDSACVDHTVRWVQGPAQLPVRPC